MHFPSLLLLDMKVRKVNNEAFCNTLFPASEAFPIQRNDRRVGIIEWAMRERDSITISRLLRNDAVLIGK
jgi:hypothetical protein